jgi:hypothetical protein
MSWARCGSTWYSQAERVCGAMLSQPATSQVVSLPALFLLVSLQLAVLWSLLTTQPNPAWRLQTNSVYVQLPRMTWELAPLLGDDLR